MNELETILKILESHLKPSSEYTEEEIERFFSLFQKVYSILNKKAPIASLNDDDINYLKEKGIIEKDNDNIKNYVTLLGYYSRIIDPSRKDEIAQATDAELSSIIEKLTEITKRIDDTETKTLIEKVKSGFKDFREKDLDLLHQYILESNLEDEQKRDLTLYVLLKTVDFDNIFEMSKDTEEKEHDEYAKDYEEIELSKKGLTEEECTELFAKYGYNFKDLGRRINDQPDKVIQAQELIKEKGNYEQIDKILKLLKEKNIDLTNNGGCNILKEKGNNLAHIFIKSNDRCVKEIIDFSEQYGFTDNGVPNFYKMVISTRKFILRKIKYKPSRITDNPGGGKNGDSIGGSHEDFMKNVELFSNICSRLHTDKVVFLKAYYEKYNGELLDESHDKVLGIIEILKKYGYKEKDYFNRATSIFKSTHIADTLDLSIELNLYDYLQDNPSTFQLGNDELTKKRLYVLSTKKDELLQETTIPNFIGEKIAKKKIKMGGVPEIDNIIEEDKNTRTIIPKGITGIIDEKLIATYEERIREKPVDISVDEDDIDSPINALDSKYKENELLYNIEGIKISRLKVIRVYNALKDLEGLDDNGRNNVVRYALTRNSFLWPSQINELFKAFRDTKAKYMEDKRGESI